MLNNKRILYIIIIIGFIISVIITLSKNNINLTTLNTHSGKSTLEVSSDTEHKKEEAELIKLQEDDTVEWQRRQAEINATAGQILKDAGIAEDATPVFDNIAHSSVKNKKAVLVNSTEAKLQPPIDEDFTVMTLYEGEVVDILEAVGTYYWVKTSAGDEVYVRAVDILSYIDKNLSGEEFVETNETVYDMHKTYTELFPHPSTSLEDDFEIIEIKRIDKNKISKYEDLSQGTVLIKKIDKDYNDKYVLKEEYRDTNNMYAIKYKYRNTENIVIMVDGEYYASTELEYLGIRKLDRRIL